MPEYKVRLRYVTHADVTVEADDEQEAIALARDEDLFVQIMGNLDDEEVEILTDEE